MNRRFFLQLSAFAAASSLIHWNFAEAAPPQTPGTYDAVVVGAGLGGLVCAAYLSRHGFRTALIEQYDIPGGYATSFTRDTDKGTFQCEVSLHSSVLASGAMRTLLEELGVWSNLTLVPHPHAWNSHFPDFSIAVPAKCGLDGFERQLAGLFPAETAGLADLFKLWRGIMTETATLEKGLPNSEQSQFPRLFPSLWAIHDKTVGQVVNAYIRDPKLKAVLEQSCGYYGLPPSQLSAFYYLQPTGEYIEQGGSYIKGTSQALSDALAKAITDAGGKTFFGTKVAEILVENGRAVGVKTDDGQTFKAKAVVCNASAPQVFEKLLPKGILPRQEHDRLAAYTCSPSSVIVWLGLNKNITGQFPNPESSYYTGYDLDAAYVQSMNCNFDQSGFSLMAYDNLIPGFSPQGCSSLCIVSLCGYGAWQGLEAEYLNGGSAAYEKKKKEVTDLLIAQVEKLAIPGLSKMIIMRDSSTPLTNVRFTLNTAGAIYGYNQSVDNSFMTRQPNTTSVPGLFLASAWGNPGGGFGGALGGGKSAFRDVAKALTSAT